MSSHLVYNKIYALIIFTYQHGEHIKKNLGNAICQQCVFHSKELKHIFLLTYLIYLGFLCVCERIQLYMRMRNVYHGLMVYVHMHAYTHACTYAPCSSTHICLIANVLNISFILCNKYDIFYHFLHPSHPSVFSVSFSFRLRPVL